MPAQGWKIHVSATPQNAIEILTAVVPIIVNERVAFKFAADQHILRLLISKQWPRGSAGKFITVYPTSLAQFLSLIEAIHQATRMQVGPYILSDRRYKDSKSVFYRYGSLLARTYLRINGESAHYMVSPNGDRVRDIREPWFVLPAWVEDPFPELQTTSLPPNGLKDGRYQITAALRFSNSGGVYLGFDNNTGAQVVIKEARPRINVEAGSEDAITLLRKEYRILTKVQESKISPHPIDFFEEWEHCFLVEEFIAGTTLRNHAGTHVIALRMEPSREEIEEFVNIFRRVFLPLTTALSALHQHGVVFRDLSPKNVIIMPTGEVKFVDFEAACEIGVDRVTSLFTPGFAAADHFSDKFAHFENDYFSLGALMLSYMLPIHALAGLDPNATDRFANAIFEDYGLPDNIRMTITGLLRNDPTARPSTEQVITQLETESAFHPVRLAESLYREHTECHQVLNDVVDTILKTASYHRSDRLFPADPKVFVTNSLSIAYGACGVAYAINRIRGELPLEVSDWILNHKIEPGLYPPGLYIGMAGIAWVLLELGFTDKAERILLASHKHPLLFEAADMFYGLSGWGLAHLKFYHLLNKQIYLDRAIEAGDSIIHTYREDPDGYYWDAWDSHGETWIGLGHGASGIALFLLYLSIATGRDDFLKIGERALQFDLSQAVRRRRGLTWPTHKATNASLVPYWRYGSAGVGVALLRFLQVSKNHDLRAFVDDIFFDTAKKYTIFPGKFFGLAGLGDFLLDAADFETDRERYLSAARLVASGIKLFQVNPPGHGPAFPGYDLWKISCDYGSGAAGIGLFLHRMLTRGKPDFMMDELLPVSVRSQQGKTDLVVTT